ncbi:hypothetical protein WA026_023035 [Henosepilachna vigintioctopunctata]|uniref:Secreted protein n=1 Tax=Henosepilachna vigintioctopunctata TaxID=420089 RepID=A0AAW1VGL7_9CUCU
MMFNRLMFLMIVIYTHNLVTSNTRDDELAADNCFRTECRHTFVKRLAVIPLCGTDEKPYQSWRSISCAYRCKKRYNIRFQVLHRGYCVGKPTAPEYWGIT